MSEMDDVVGFRPSCPTRRRVRGRRSANSLGRRRVAEIRDE